MTSRAVLGEEVPIPTLLLVESTTKALVLTARSLETTRLARVVLPVTVSLPVVASVELRERVGEPMVLLEGRDKIVGTCF